MGGVATAAAPPQATEVDSCTTITSPGAYALTQDIRNSSADVCIEIRADDVAFYGEGHTIDGTETLNGSVDYDESLPVGLRVDNASNVTVENVVVTNWEAGLQYRTATDGRITGVNATLNSQFGIELEDTTNSVVENVTTNDNGVEVGGATTKELVAGLGLFSSDDNTVRNVESRRNTRHGVIVASQSTGNTFESVTSATNGGDGLTLRQSSTDNVVENNRLIDNGQIALDGDGIELTQFSANNTVRDNVIRGSNSDGVSVNNDLNSSYRDPDPDAGANANRVIGNEIVNNARGVHLYHANDTVVMDNQILESNRGNVRILGGSNNELASNEIRAAGDDGVRLSSTDDNDIVENTIVENGEDGVDLVDSDNNLIARNTIENNSGEAVLVRGNSTGNDVQTANDSEGNETGAANFSVSDLSAPENATVGDAVTVTANVTNAGETNGSQTVEFRIDLNDDGTPEAIGLNESVSLDAGANETVGFEVPTDGVEPGTYTHGVYTDNDSATTTLTVEAADDDGGEGNDTDVSGFAVSELSAPANATGGNPITVNATVTNTGDSRDTQRVQYRFDVNETNETVTRNEWVSLDPGANATVSFTVWTGGVRPGTYTHGVYTDDDNATAQLTVTKAVYYSVTNATVPTNATQGETITLNATVTNLGSEEGWQRIQYKIDLNNNGTLEPVGVSQPVRLAPDESRTVSLDVPTDDFETGTYEHGIYSYQEWVTTNLTVESADDSEPAVTFDDQPPNGTTVSVASVTVPDGGFVAIHNETDGDVGPVVGVSAYLPAGVHEDVNVTLYEGVNGANFSENATVEDGRTLIAMPHLDTNGNETYDFVSSNGSADGPYTVDGSAVTDSATVTNESSDDSDDGSDSGGDDSGGDDDGDDGDDSDDSDDDNSGSGGGSGGDAAQSTSRYRVVDVNSGVTVSVTEVLSDSPLDAEMNVSGAGISVTSLGLDTRFATSDFRIEVDTPTASAGDAPALADATPVAYFRAESVGFNDARIGSANVSVTVSELPADASPEDVVIYRLVDGSWTALETTRLDDGSYEAQTDGFTTFAVGVSSASDDGDATTTEQPDDSDSDADTDTATPAAADDSTATATDGGSAGATETTTPGFGVVLAVLAVLGAALLAGRRD
ncbi:CHRD domain containing protein [Candidatus Halobonum tyrrellensis G22]|uniref:CHRD domain containing protein n=1 Tax=Candidatus Halobonum tyrrellensis G22 TaxID=1324957 RepID=V4HCJ6_9EURY|nr:CHRD domain containing protein [Candidatus Halobonum tyrrellensis G22]